jgi:hypothetical protein
MWLVLKINYKRPILIFHWKNDLLTSLYIKITGFKKEYTRLSHIFRGKYDLFIISGIEATHSKNRVYKTESHFLQKTRLRLPTSKLPV